MGTITGSIYSRGSQNGANTVKAYNRFDSKTLVVIDAEVVGYIPSDEGYENSIKISATSGTSVLVSGVSNRQIEVLSYTVDASGATNIKFLSGSTDITGPMTMGANQVITNSEAGLKTGLGEALSINLTASAVNGHLAYRLV